MTNISTKDIFIYLIVETWNLKLFQLPKTIVDIRRGFRSSYLRSFLLHILSLLYASSKWWIRLKQMGLERKTFIENIKLFPPLFHQTLCLRHRKLKSSIKVLPVKCRISIQYPKSCIRWHGLVFGVFVVDLLETLLSLVLEELHPWGSKCIMINQNKPNAFWFSRMIDLRKKLIYLLS